MRGAQVKFAGLVLSRHNYREADMLVKILTDQYGIRTFICHRARKPGFQFAAGILPFTHAQYWGTIKDGFSYITSVRDANQFQHIAGDLMANAYATYVLGLIDLAFPENEPIPQWFNFAKAALQKIDDGVDAQIIGHIAEIQLLGAFGVAPHWQDCTVCGRSDLPLDFSEAYGGVLCSNHWQLDEHRYHVSPRSMYYLRLFSTITLKQLGKVNVAPATKVELRTIIDRLYEDMVGVTPRAKRFLDQMLSGSRKLKPLSPR
ncbi:DNA repair protein RecO [Lacticaseibacillus hulanensis]|uniref:DNA repair protein RecO n=1 Tax=Lacticaseibacillus hulanensis TaxID=2493111 RepID=UPI000FD8A512|nr:DNA repair protein RecO [Lacticaseibacillus hulanensis]